MASGASGGGIAFEETQHADPLVCRALGLLSVVSALPAAALAVLSLVSGSQAVGGPVLAVAASLPAFVLLVFYVPHRAKRLRTVVTDDEIAIEMEGLLTDRGTRVPLDAVTRVTCWEEFGRLRALVARFSGEGPGETADRTHELGTVEADREMTTDTYLLRYRSASPDRTYAGLVRIDRRSGPPTYVGSSRAGELTDAVVRCAESGRDA